MVDTSKCPCGNSQPYDDCCKPLHQGIRQANTAEELMRSRYSGYVKKLQNYLFITLSPSERGSIDEISFETGLRWLGLKIISTKAGLENDTEGQVEFIASYNYLNKPGSIKEHSLFKKEDGRWYYAGIVKE